MKQLDKQLDIIQKDTLQEIDPITTTLALGTIVLISSLVMLLIGATTIINSVKVDKTLSKRLNKILNSGNKWIVHIFPTKEANAFSLGFGKHVFVTSQLLKILSPDEIDSILLHEVYHSQKKHAYKQLAYKYPLFYLVIFIGTSILTTPVVPILAILAMFIANTVGDIVFKITFGRKMEYNADSYAAKLGYGKQLISAIEKLKQWAKANSKNQKCGRWCKIINKINSSIDEHPEWHKRIENILKNTKELTKVLKTKSFGKIKDFITKEWGK